MRSASEPYSSAPDGRRTTPCRRRLFVAAYGTMRSPSITRVISYRTLPAAKTQKRVRPSRGSYKSSASAPSGSTAEASARALWRSARSLRRASSLGFEMGSIADKRTWLLATPSRDWTMPKEDSSDTLGFSRNFDALGADDVG